MSAIAPLFTPISIGTMLVKNRLVMAPITTNYGTNNQEPSPRLLAYLEERAKGGVGLITVEVCSIDVKHRYQMNSLSLGDDSYIDHHKTIVEVIHRHGAKAQPQITHPGPESLSLLLENMDSVGPSPVCGLGNRAPCRELSIDEIEVIIEQYAQAARRAKAAGYDGMELHAAHAYMLIASFLSPWRNKRRDEYGRRTGRYKLLLEVIKRMKSATGGDFPLTLRISGFERLKGGRELNETQEWAPIMVEAGVNAFHLTGGYAGDYEASMTICGSNRADGYNVAEAQALKQVVDVPVMVVGRIHDPQFANRIIEENQADLVVMGRPMLADPELANKARQGKFDEIRRCISCQNCIDTLTEGNMTCAVNARSGKELELPLKAAEKIKTVMIIGAGTAGMEAARIAAERGHTVMLHDKAPYLGGSLRIASTVHSDNEPILNYLITQMHKLPIDINLGAEVSLDTIRRKNPDTVIVATGAKLVNNIYPGDDQSHVYKGSQLKAIMAGDNLLGLPRYLSLPLKLATSFLKPLTKIIVPPLLSPQFLRWVSKLWMPIGKKVVIIGTSLAAVELAEFLAKRGRKVCIISENDRIAPEVGMRRRSDHMDNLDELAVVVNTAITVRRITRQGIAISNKLGLEHLIKADNIIIAGESAADQQLFEQVKTLVEDVHSIGDCNGLGLIAGATADAMRVASII